MFIDGGPLRPEDVVAVATRHERVDIAPAVYERMTPARRLVEQVIEDGRIVYGVTTGFGALANTPIGRQETGELQVHLLRSHAAGVGERLPDEVVRAMLLLRARTLAQGHSGVRPVLVERYVEFLNRDLLPVVPSQGSVGASGDLAPFAHLALPLIGEGLLSARGVVRQAAEVLFEEGIEPIRLEPKEGLSLLNGTEGMLAQGVLNLARAERLVETADLASRVVGRRAARQRPAVPTRNTCTTTASGTDRVGSSHCRSPRWVRDRCQSQGRLHPCRSGRLQPSLCPSGPWCSCGCAHLCT